METVHLGKPSGNFHTKIMFLRLLHGELFSVRDKYFI